MTLTCRRAAVADAALLHAMLQGVADTDGAGPVGPVTALVRHGFGARPLFAAIIAEDAGEPAGMVLFYPDFSTLRGQPGVYVQDLYVDPHWRGQGIARLLLARAMEDAAADYGAAYLTLAVDPGNARARRLYDGLGFRRRGYDYMILEGAGLSALMAQ